MRKNIFNLFLIAVAICDMTLMASYLLYKLVELCHPWYFTYAWIVFTYFYAVFSVFVHSLSLWLTVNMAVLRFLVLRNASSNSSLNLNSQAAAWFFIGIAFVISLVGSTPNMLRYEIQDRGDIPSPSECVRNESSLAESVRLYSIGQPPFWNCSWERFSFWAAGIILKLVPCILLTIFMTLLVRMLVEARERRSRLVGNAAALRRGSVQQGSAKSQAERTTAMLTIIVAVFLITELPQGILVIAIGVQPTAQLAMRHLGNLLDLLSLLNSSVNFILYSTMSNVFRQEFLDTFGACSRLIKTGSTQLSDARNANGSLKIKLLRTPSGRLQNATTTTPLTEPRKLLIEENNHSGMPNGEYKEL
uniref:G-protein coupled receptors family 1 profile domain-containing protein n=1 Tax=Acrobeloides nanus TaxID=290746 RepID=A0A914CPF2_9BILA